MQFINIKNQNIFIYLVFSAIFLLGLNIHKDYGTTIDDEFYRQNGEFYYEYIKALFFDSNLYGTKDLELLSKIILGEGDGVIINHPVLFELLLATFINFFNISGTKEIYEFSHLLNFIIFYLSLICFYCFLNNYFQSKLLAITSILILLFTPRILAESFYNSRDIFFLSLYIFNLSSAFFFLKNENFKSAFLFSLTSALLINAKVLGIVPPILFLLFYLFNNISKNKINFISVKYFSTIIFLTFFFIYLFWPYIWLDPVEKFIDAISSIIIAQNGVSVINFYFGEYMFSTNTPWHYRIIWALITTPSIVLVFFLLGFFITLYKIIKSLININEKNEDLWKNNLEMFSFYLSFTLIIIFFVTIKFNTSQFGGWRHLYFLYPVIIFFSVIGFKSIFKFFANSKFLLFINIIFIVNLSYIIFWSYVYHPHQQVFFNYFSKEYSKKNFDLDYWGVSHIYSLKYILKKNPNTKIKLGAISFTRLEESILMLDEKQKKNIILVSNLNEADFLIDNYIKRFRNNFVIDKKEYSKYFEIIVNEYPINTVYKKIN
jgi:hypothetical protein